MSDSIPFANDAPASPSRLIEEGLIDFNEAAKACCDARGRKPHIATLRRWAKIGCRGHRLESAFLGNRLMTSRQAVARFLAAINGQAAPVLSQSTSAAEQAGRELDVLMKSPGAFSRTHD